MSDGERPKVQGTLIGFPQAPAQPAAEPAQVVPDTGVTDPGPPVGSDAARAARANAASGSDAAPVHGSSEAAPAHVSAARDFVASAPHAGSEAAPAHVSAAAAAQPSAPVRSELPPAHVVAAEKSWGVAQVLTENPGSRFVSFLKISAKRAFRLRIEPTEVLPSEKAALEGAHPPIVDQNLQAFLAWRRSVLFLVACALIPLTTIGFFDALLVGQATPIRVIKMAPIAAEGLFLGICWLQLRNWAHWRRQRRWLLIGWLFFMATPFVVFVYPLRTVFDHGGFTLEDAKALGLDALTKDLIPFKITMIAMLQLAPKAISLMPGLVRASLVIKLLFPGSPAPGWLIVVAAPIYALLAYVILIVPYQFTGSGWFVGGVIGVITGQILLARSGFALAQPLTEAEALVTITRVRKIYISIMLGSAVLIIIALGSLVAQLKLHWLDVILSVLKFETNVLILTMIGSDLVITNLDAARAKNMGRYHVEEQAEAKIAAFVSLDAPHEPPPSGPASYR